MKFLTLEASRAEDDDEPDGGIYLRALKAYLNYLEELAPLLPPHLLQLAQLPGVDDGLVVEAHHLRSQSRLLLILRCGFIDIGYYDLVLAYEGAEISPEHEWVLAQIARGGEDKYDLCAHEVDIEDDGRVAHRILYHPGIWFGIRCRELHWETVDRPDRSLPPLPDRFPGGPAAPPPARSRPGMRGSASATCSIQAGWRTLWSGRALARAVHSRI